MQKLNELKGNCDQIYSTETIRSSTGQSSAVPPVDVRDSAQCVTQPSTQTNCFDFDDEYCDDDFSQLSTEHVKQDNGQWKQQIKDG